MRAKLMPPPVYTVLDTRNDPNRAGDKTDLAGCGRLRTPSVHICGSAVVVDVTSTAGEEVKAGSRARMNLVRAMADLSGGDIKDKAGEEPRSRASGGASNAPQASRAA